jgi:hypothetical protein
VKILIAVILLFVANTAQAYHLLANPALPNAQGQLPTHCAVAIDALPDVVVPMTPGETVPPPNNTAVGTMVCYFNGGNPAAGAHTGKAKHQWIDPTGTFATAESGYSNVVNFTVPGAGPAPTVLKLTP